MDKLKFHLHIGTEKTGTSYIQSLLARNREQLWADGVHYPLAGKWEREMQSGRISPGNGEDLLIALKNKNWHIVREILSDFAEGAFKRNCHTLLVSNENLIEPLSQEGLLQRMIECCSALQIDSPHILLVLRDPVDQALSLYKHRAKSGNVTDIVSWLKQSYQLPIYLNKFFDQLKIINCVYSLRRYDKSSRYLTKLFFLDWLGLKWPQYWEDASVNPSLSLSELEMLKQLRITSPELVPFFYQRMLRMPIIEKADDLTFRKYFQAIFNNHLFQFNRVWERCNEMLPSTDTLQVPLEKVSDVTQKKILSFSERQIEELLVLMRESRSLSFKIQLIVHYTRPYLARIKWFALEVLKRRQ